MGTLLIPIVLLALMLAGCGSSSPQINAHPQTIALQPKAKTAKPSAKLTAFEYRKIKTLSSKLKTAKKTMTSGNLGDLMTVCRAVGNRTPLLTRSEKACARMIAFLSETLKVGACFKDLSSGSFAVGSPAAISELYRCDRVASPLAARAKRLASSMRSLTSTVRERGFTGKCYSYLAGSAAAANSLDKLASQTNAMASAGLSQNVSAAVSATQGFSALLQQVGKQLSSGPQSIKVCKHT